MGRATKHVQLRELAHSRAGEKGDVVYVSLIAHDERAYPLLEREVTADVVRAAFGAVLRGRVERFEVPRIGALNFALHGALGGGRARNLGFEESGKAFSSRLLGIEIEVDADQTLRSEQIRAAGLSG